MKKYKHILFDLDHTLWDFEKNSQETLVELYKTFSLARFNRFTCDQFCYTFREVNHHLWDLYHRGEYDQQRLRKERFIIILGQLGITEAYVPSGLAEAYLQLCPTKPHIFPYALEVLKYLQDRYSLHILTNGFNDVQAIKMKNAGLSDFFVEVVTSDATGYKKPHPGIFEFMLQKIGAQPEDCVMIGDNLEADMQGAKNARIDCIFFNPVGIEHQVEVTHEINCLSQLQVLL